jgi:hypothetical protein
MGDDKPHWTTDPAQLWAYAQMLETSHGPRLAMDRAMLRLGYSRPTLGGVAVDPASGLNLAQDAYDAFRSLGHSLTHEVVGAAAAQTVRPLQVKVVPSGGDPELIQQCEDASTAVNGILDGNNFLVDVAQRWVLDGLHCSVGFVKVAVDKMSGDLEVTRVDPLLMRWPRDVGTDLYDIVELQSVPRRRLLAAYKGNAKAIVAIKFAPTWTPQTVAGVEQSIGGSSSSDCIKVLDAYAVQLGDKPGRHVVAIQGYVLEDDEYLYDILPYAPYRWDWDFRGYEGVSLARTIAPYDVWSRELVRVHYESLKAGIPVIFEHESESAFEGLTDLPYQRARYNGAQPPTIQVAGKVSQDVVAQIQALRERAFAQAGVSLQAAQGQIPPGFKSAPSINAWSEVINLRSLQQQQRYEGSYGGVGKLICLFAPDAYKGRSIHIRSPNAEYLRSVKFPNLSANKYRVSVLMTSGLPRTFSGRVSAIETLKDLGAIKPGQEARMLEVPDLEAVNSEAMAPRKLAESIVSGALDPKEPTYPKYGVPNIPELIAELLPLARARYQHAMQNGNFSDEALATIHRVIRVAESLAAPPPPVGAPVGTETAQSAAGPSPAQVPPPDAAPLAPVPVDVPPPPPPM